MTLSVTPFRARGAVAVANLDIIDLPARVLGGIVFAILALSNAMVDPCRRKSAVLEGFSFLRTVNLGAGDSDRHGKTKPGRVALLLSWFRICRKALCPQKTEEVNVTR
jgi:hypothetical protein